MKKKPFFIVCGSQSRSESDSEELKKLIRQVSRVPFTAAATSGALVMLRSLAVHASNTFTPRNAPHLVLLNLSSTFTFTLNETSKSLEVLSSSSQHLSTCPPIVLCKVLARMASSTSQDEGKRYKIYTRTGDKGSSSLYTGERREKNDIVFEALGDTDELNSILGVAREHCENLPGCDRLCSELEVIQSRLMDVGSAVATPLDTAQKGKAQRAAFPQGLVKDLEEWIDFHDESLPALMNFILPSGGQASSFLHMARTVCRRAERKIVPLVKEEKVQLEVGHYMNRLSDYLFTVARVAAKAAKKDEVVYKKI